MATRNKTSTPVPSISNYLAIVEGPDGLGTVFVRSASREGAIRQVKIAIEEQSVSMLDTSNVDDYPEDFSVMLYEVVGDTPIHYDVEAHGIQLVQRKN